MYVQIYSIHLENNYFGLHYLVSFNGNNILPVVIFLSQIY